MEGVLYGVFEFHRACNQHQMKEECLVFINLLLDLHRWSWLHNGVSPKCICFASDRLVIANFQNASRIGVLHSKATEPQFRRPFLETIPNNIFAGCLLSDVIYAAVNLHLGYNPSIGTDIESLMYNIIEMRFGKQLSWYCFCKKDWKDTKREIFVGNLKTAMLLGKLPGSVQKEIVDWPSDLNWLNLGGVLYQLAVSIHSLDETSKTKNVIDFILDKFNKKDCCVSKIMAHNYQLLISRRSKVTSEMMDDAFVTSPGKRIENLGEELSERLSQVDLYIGGRESVGLDSEKVISLRKMLSNFCSTGVESEVAKMVAQRQVFGGPVHLATTSKAYSMRRIFGDQKEVVTEVDLVGITPYSTLEFLREWGSCLDTGFLLVDVVQSVAADSSCVLHREEVTNVMQGYAEWRLYEKLYPEIKGVYERNDCNWIVCEISMSKNVDECMCKVLQLEADLLVLLCNLHEKKTELCIHPLQLAKIPVWCLVALLLKLTFSQNMDQLIRNCIYEIPCCRVLMLQGRLLWGFFRNGYLQRSFCQVQNWGFSMQKSLRNVSMEMNVIASAVQSLLLETKRNSEKLDSLSQKIDTLMGHFGL